ncbi:MAG TPA: DivIVA domain-containing protein [Acidimicrobiales bacterium]
MTDLPGQHARRPTQRLTPERVRSMRFGRTPIGRRGISEEEVGRFLHRVAEELAARDAAEAALRAKAQHYKDTLVRWQRDQTEPPDDAAEGPPQYARPPAGAVNILARAQQEADSYIAQTQEYCRQLTADAERHADEIVNEARTRASAEAARTRGTPPAGPPPGDVAPLAARGPAGGAAAHLEELQRRLVWARAFVTSLETVEAQLRVAREALSYEFEKLDGPAPDHPR